MSSPFRVYRFTDRSGASGSLTVTNMTSDYAIGTWYFGGDFTQSAWRLIRPAIRDLSRSLVFSTHRDADWDAKVARYLGIEVVPSDHITAGS